MGSLLREAWNQRRKLRLVSVRFSGVEESGAQLEMFAQGDEKRRKLAAVLDRLNGGGTSAGVSRGHQLGGRKRD
jgi:DNA polymerase-4